MEKVIEDLKRLENVGRELLGGIPGFVAMANPGMVTKAQSFVDGVAAARQQLEQIKNGNSE